MVKKLRFDGISTGPRSIGAPGSSARKVGLFRAEPLPRVDLVDRPLSIPPSLEQPGLPGPRLDVPALDLSRAEAMFASYRTKSVEIRLDAKAQKILADARDDASILGRRLGKCGVTADELEHFMRTGEVSAALAATMKIDDYPPIGVTKAALELRASYLEAAGDPGAKAMQKAAKTYVQQAEERRLTRYKDNPDALGRIEADYRARKAKTGSKAWDRLLGKTLDAQGTALLASGQAKAAAGMSLDTIFELARGSGAEALFAEAETLVPALANDPAHRAKRSALLETRIDLLSVDPKLTLDEKLGLRSDQVALWEVSDAPDTRARMAVAIATDDLRNEAIQVQAIAVAAEGAMSGQSVPAPEGIAYAEAVVPRPDIVVATREEIVAAPPEESRTAASAAAALAEIEQRRTELFVGAVPLAKAAAAAGVDAPTPESYASEAVGAKGRALADLALAVQATNTYASVASPLAAVDLRTGVATVGFLVAPDEGLALLESARRGAAKMDPASAEGLAAYAAIANTEAVGLALLDRPTGAYDVDMPTEALRDVVLEKTTLGAIAADLREDLATWEQGAFDAGVRANVAEAIDTFAALVDAHAPSFGFAAYDGDRVANDRARVTEVIDGPDGMKAQLEDRLDRTVRAPLDFFIGVGKMLGADYTTRGDVKAAMAAYFDAIESESYVASRAYLDASAYLSRFDDPTSPSNYVLAGFARDWRADAPDGSPEHEAWKADIEAFVVKTGHSSATAEAVAFAMTTDPRYVAYRQASSTSGTAAFEVSSANEPSMFQYLLAPTGRDRTGKPSDLSSFYAKTNTALLELEHDASLKAGNFGVELALSTPFALVGGALVGATRVGAWWGGLGTAAAELSGASGVVAPLALGTAEIGVGMGAGWLIHEGALAAGMKEGSGAIAIADIAGAAIGLGTKSDVAKLFGRGVAKDFASQLVLGAVTGGAPIGLEALGVSSELAEWTGLALSFGVPLALGAAARAKAKGAPTPEAAEALKRDLDELAVPTSADDLAAYAKDYHAALMRNLGAGDWTAARTTADALTIAEVMRVADTLATPERSSEAILQSLVAADEVFAINPYYLGAAAPSALDRPDYDSAGLASGLVSGMGNRVAYQGRLLASVESKMKSGGEILVGTIDIDRFREVGNAGGAHDQGDKMIAALGATLSSNVADLQTRFPGLEVFHFQGKSFKFVYSGERPIAEVASAVADTFMRDDLGVASKSALAKSAAVTEGQPIETRAADYQFYVGMSAMRFDAAKAPTAADVYAAAQTINDEAAMAGKAAQLGDRQDFASTHEDGPAHTEVRTYRVPEDPTVVDATTKARIDRIAAAEPGELDFFGNTLRPPALEIGRALLGVGPSLSDADAARAVLFANDGHHPRGQAVGKLLMEEAYALARAGRSASFVARTGGDEFSGFSTKNGVAYFTAGDFNSAGATNKVPGRMSNDGQALKGSQVADEVFSMFMDGAELALSRPGEPGAELAAIAGRMQIHLASDPALVVSERITLDVPEGFFERGGSLSMSVPDQATGGVKTVTFEAKLLDAEHLEIDGETVRFSQTAEGRLRLWIDRPDVRASLTTFTVAVDVVDTHGLSPEQLPTFASVLADRLAGYSKDLAKREMFATGAGYRPESFNRQMTLEEIRTNADPAIRAIYEATLADAKAGRLGAYPPVSEAVATLAQRYLVGDPEVRPPLGALGLDLADAPPRWTPPEVLAGIEVAVREAASFAEGRLDRVATYLEIAAARGVDPDTAAQGAAAMMAADRAASWTDDPNARSILADAYAAQARASQDLGVFAASLESTLVARGVPNARDLVQVVVVDLAAERARTKVLGPNARFALGLAKPERIALMNAYDAAITEAGSYFTARARPIPDRAAFVAQLAKVGTAPLISRADLDRVAPPSLTPAEKDALYDAVKAKLHDPKQLYNWGSTVLGDAVVESILRGTPPETRALAAGEVTREVVYEVLYQRAVKGGWEVMEADNEPYAPYPFRTEVLAQGRLFTDPFFRKTPGATYPHGMDAHVLQLLMITPAIDTQLGFGATKTILQKLGGGDVSKDAWGPLFDAVVDNLSMPENFFPLMNTLLPIE